MGWDTYDRQLVLALRDNERIADENRCPACGGDKRECQDPANGRAFDVALARCYRTKVVSRTLEARDDRDPRALVASTILRPERVKPTD